MGIEKISAKLTAPAISWPLMVIINHSITSRIMPCEWKIASVTPFTRRVHETCLTTTDQFFPVISKIYEKILYEQLTEYLENETILTDHQFGFRRFHSTASAFLDCTNKWYVNMDRCLYNMVVFLDLKKVFDIVNHEILLNKFVAYGITDSALDLLSSYLTDRKQKCQLNGISSQLRKIHRAVPQESILGPLLLIYINDLPNCLEYATPRLFADDKSITVAGKLVNETKVTLNHDVVNMKNWLSANKLNLNIAKTEYMLIGPKPVINTLELPHIFIENDHVERVHKIKILYVHIDESLTWEKHR